MLPGMPIQTCSPIRVNNSMKAERLDPNSHGGGTLSKAVVLTGDRAPISVQRETADGSMQVVGTEEFIKPSEGAEPSFTTTPERVYADSKLLESATENGIGAKTAPRSAVVLDANAAVEPPKVDMKQEKAPVVVAPPVQVKVRVALSNKSMGKHRITVRSVAISDSLVILAYPKDSDNIIEPPVCGTDEPIRVDYNGESYHCVFGGWTAELEGMFLVVMIRHDLSHA